MTRVNKENAAEFLQQFPIFQDLSPEELKQVEEIAISRSISKNCHFSEGSEKKQCSSSVPVLSKRTKQMRTDMNRLSPSLKTGDMFPHTGFFNAHPYPATAVAITPTSLLAIPSGILNDLCSAHLRLLLKSCVCSAIKYANYKINYKCFRVRMCAIVCSPFLLMLAEQHGQPQADKIIINLPMTHQEFANSIGTTRETANRLLNQLSKDELLEVDRSRIIIHNLQALKEQRDA